MTINAPQVFKTITSYRMWRRSLQNTTKVGFIPTMGALHQGHLSLFKKSLTENDITVISIFVNPSQFAPTEDLDSYPRTFENDFNLVADLNVNGKTIDAILYPSVEELYPSGIPLDVSKQTGAFVTVHGLSEQLEGTTRPNFFRGVATVVTKLFNITQPDVAYFGQKDVQQSIVLKRMVRDLLLPIELKIEPIVREESGLALSSRNAYLSEELRQKCARIYAALRDGEEAYKVGKSRDQILQTVQEGLVDEQFKIDYVSLADKESLVEVEDLSNGAVLSLAVYVTESDKTTRLIDNIIL